MKRSSRPRLPLGTKRAMTILVPSGDQEGRNEWVLPPLWWVIAVSPVPSGLTV